MNWLSAIDIIPLSVMVLCAGDQLRQVVVRKQPLVAILLVVIAVFAFHMIVRAIHGADSKAWVVAIDWVLAMLFVYQTLTFHPEESSDEFGQSDRHPV